MSKIYTKTGDTGETSLLGGKRVPKFHPRVEAYGTIDELNSFIGLLRFYVNETDKRTTNSEQLSTNTILLDIQNHLYRLGSLIACDSCKEQKKLPQITQEDIEFLEGKIDEITNQLPELTAFIVPGGNESVCYAHISRCVCRRAERAVIQLSTKTPVDNLIIIYLNRLSDFLFTLARKLSRDSGFQEIKYKDL